MSRSVVDFIRRYVEARLPRAKRVSVRWANDRDSYEVVVHLANEYLMQFSLASDVDTRHFPRLIDEQLKGYKVYAYSLLELLND